MLHWWDQQTLTEQNNLIVIAKSDFGHAKGKQLLQETDKLFVHAFYEYQPKVLDFVVHKFLDLPTQFMKHFIVLTSYYGQQILPICTNRQ